MNRLISGLLLCTVVSCAGETSAHRSTTVVYASGADLQSINPLVTVHPLAKAVQKHVLFLTLASYDSLLSPVPRLASWTWNEDRSTLDFNIRSDVRWQDGAPTSAADVVWTIDMAMNPAVAYPRARDLAAVRDVRALDEHTVRVEFGTSPPTFPDVFTDLPILPAHLLGSASPDSLRSHDFNRSPLGNGPFAFAEYRPNQLWVFERSEVFPPELGRPGFDRFAVVVVDEPATKLAALTSGELDFAGISPAHASFVREDENLYTIDYPIRFVYALVWNLRREPFDDERVRRALTMAIDRDLVVEAYLYGYGTVAGGPVPPEHPWHADVPLLPHDVDAAASLLDESGWRVGDDGVRRRGSSQFTVELLTVGSGDAPLEQMIQAQLKDVGVEVVIHQHEMTSFLAIAQAESRDYDALVIGVPGDLTLSYVAAMFDGREPGPLAYPGYRSDRFDRMMEAVARAHSEESLIAIWKDTQRLLADDLPTTWLYHARGLQGANRRITDTAIDFRGELSGISRWRIRRPD